MAPQSGQHGLSSSVLDFGWSYKFHWFILSLLLGWIVTWAISRLHAPTIPVVNAYRGDFMRKRAHAEFTGKARELIAQGLKLFKGPFRILTPLGSCIVLPPSYADWVRKCEDLDHQALVAHEYLASTPGFDGLQIVTDPDRLLIDVTRTKLSQNAESIATMHDHVTELLDETWTDIKEWHSITLGPTTLALISRAAAAVFVGSVLARDSVWEELTMTYTLNTFGGVYALRGWPALVRPLVHWFLPACRVCRAQVKLARCKISAELARRKHLKEEAGGDGRLAPRFSDTIEWLREDPKGRTVDAAGAQLAFAISALHTTTELLRQAMLDIFTRPELVVALRDEITTALSGSGWTLKGLAKMQLLDSCFKETQRLKPGALVNMERKALRDVVMPNGVVLKKGSNVAVDTSAMWDPAIYENPEEYDGYRFLRLRQSVASADVENHNKEVTGQPIIGAAASQFASSSPEHFAFGMGKAICPGRFLVANELKVVLGLMLLQYDMRLKGAPGTEKFVERGFEMLSNAEAVVEVRRRD